MFDDDFNYRERPDLDPELCDGVTLFDKINNELQYGRQLDEINKLSQLDRQLFQEQDFFFVGTRVFKKIDPIEQALEGDIGHDITEADKEARDEWERRLAEEIDPEYQDAMDYIVEQPLEDLHVHPQVVKDPTEHFKVISIDFLGLTGPYVAFGYSMPRDRYKFIGNFAPNRSMMKAREREERYKWILSDIKNTENIKELNRFIVSLHDDYNEDKELRRRWSESNRCKARPECELTLREGGADEETIRRKIWNEFDKQAGRFKTRTGHYVKSLGSRWIRNRSRAYQNLKLTYRQWQDIYKCIDKQKEYFLVDRSVEIYKKYEKSVNHVKSISELQNVHKQLLESSGDLNREHRQRIWKIWGVKARQKGLRGRGETNEIVF